MRIVKASLQNLDLVVPLFDSYRQFYEQKTDINSAEKFLSERIKNNESVIFLAIDEKKNSGMGFIQLYPAFSSVSMRKIWILNDLFIHEDYRLKGVAEELINKTKSFSRETDAKGFILETHNSNIKAQNLYDKMGFEKDDDHFLYYFEV